jgi:hypothetical protein
MQLQSIFSIESFKCLKCASGLKAEVWDLSVSHKLHINWNVVEWIVRRVFDICFLEYLKWNRISKYLFYFHADGDKNSLIEIDTTVKFLRSSTKLKSTNYHKNLIWNPKFSIIKNIWDFANHEIFMTNVKSFDKHLVKLIKVYQSISFLDLNISIKIRNF